MNKVNFFRPANVGGLIEFQFTEMIDNTTIIILEGKMYNNTGRIETAKLSLVCPSFFNPEEEMVPGNSFSIYGWDHICTFLSHFCYAGKAIEEFTAIVKQEDDIKPFLSERRKSIL